jgi:flavocytochrome c
MSKWCHVVFSLALLVPLAAPVRSGLSAQAKPGKAAATSGDVIVVGAGIAGLSAALEAARGGATVTVLDMWSIFGGHAVMSEGGLCIVNSPMQQSRGIHDSPDLAYRDFLDWGEDPNRDWVRYYVDHSRADIYDWVTSMGVRFDNLDQPPGNRVPRFHRTEGRGLGLVSPIYRECARNSNLRFAWNTKVTALVLDHDKVVGVRGQNLRTGETQEFRATAVILATGGFQSNLQMVREFWPRNLPFPDGMLAGSGLNSVGSGHEVARQAGAGFYNMDHQWNYSTGLPDPRYPGLHRGLNARNNHSIWVNSSGKRFVNELAGTKVTFPALLAQKPATYWAIFDEPSKRQFWIAGSDWGDFRVIEKKIFDHPELVKSANSMADLAKAAGLPAAALQETIQHFNQMIAAGRDRDFGRFDRADDAPPRIEKPPFYAVQFFPLSRKSMGGVMIDRGCRVLDQKGRPIPGLFAAGELTGLAGINGKAGLEGTFLGPSIVTGRVAARTILTELNQRAAPASDRAATETPASNAVMPASSKDCLACHDLATEVAASRRGYSHFEKVHRVVLERKHECAQCHSIPMPFDPESHRINRLEQIENCKFCHVAEER